MKQSQMPLAINDWGVLYGFGLFETFLVNYQGKIFLLEAHLERLLASAKFFEISIKIEASSLTQMVSEYLEQNRLWGKIVRLTLLAGNELQQIPPSWHFSWRNSSYIAQKYLEGFKIGVATVQKSNTSLLLQHKTTNYLENFWLGQLALQHRMDDLLFLNTQGQITETTKSNLFFIKKGVLHTPRKETGLLPGIIRGWVLREADQLGLQVFEGDYTLEELIMAEEIFLTNSAFGVMSVQEVVCEKRYLKENFKIATLFRAKLAEKFRLC